MRSKYISLTKLDITSSNESRSLSNERKSVMQKAVRFTEFTSFKLKSWALKVAKSLPVFYTERACPLSKGGCLRSSALSFNSYPLSRFHWFLEMLRVLHVLKFEFFQTFDICHHVCKIWAAEELVQSWKKCNEFDNIEFNFIEQYLSPIFYLLFRPKNRLFVRLIIPFYARQTGTM